MNPNPEDDIPLPSEPILSENESAQQLYEALTNTKEQNYQTAYYYQLKKSGELRAEVDQLKIELGKLKQQPDPMNTQPPKGKHYDLWKHLADTHNLILLESEIEDILVHANESLRNQIFYLQNALQNRSNLAIEARNELSTWMTLATKLYNALFIMDEVTRNP